MIIFGLDGVLADWKHRRHVVDPSKNLISNGDKNGIYPNGWQPNWKSFYETCDNDEPIKSTIKVIKGLLGRDYYANDEDVHIWSGRCESVR